MDQRKLAFKLRAFYLSELHRRLDEKGKLVTESLFNAETYKLLGHLSNEIKEIENRDIWIIEKVLNHAVLGYGITENQFRTIKGLKAKYEPL